jgi:hypothetical protein
MSEEIIHITRISLDGKLPEGIFITNSSGKVLTDKEVEEIEKIRATIPPEPRDWQG